MRRRFTNVLGIDDAPFARAHRGDVPIIGAVCAGPRLDGVLRGRVRRDGANATERVASLLLSSRFEPHVRAVMLDGIALAGFNVVDLDALHARIERPVLVIARRAPDLRAMKRALLSRVPGGARKWRLIERAGPMEPCDGVFVQRRGLTLDEAREAIEATRAQGHLPEPIRLAHLIGAGLVRGASAGGA